MDPVLFRIHSKLKPQVRKGTSLVDSAGSGLRQADFSPECPVVK